MSRDSLAKLDAGGSITGGIFGVYRSITSTPAVVQESASGYLARWTAAQWAAGAPNRFPNLGQCGVREVIGTDPATPERLLDTGATLPLSGPGLPSGASLERFVAPGAAGPVYLIAPATVAFRTGLYTLIGNGGADVGPFNVSVNFPASFTVTNLASIAAIDRARPLNLTWTGEGVEYVTISISSSQNTRNVSVVCGVRASAGSFTVPASVLSALLPAPAVTFLGLTGHNTALFNPNLVQGGRMDFAIFSGSISAGKNLPAQ